MGSNKMRATIATVCAIGLLAALVACAPQANNPSTEEAALNVAPQPDQFGVIVAEQWEGLYPNQYQTWKQNEANSPESGKDNYLETYPELNTMYKGYGFAKGYDEAAGHSYTLRSIAETPRVNEKTLANCISCKTPQYTAMVQQEGDSAYAKPFADVLAVMTEPISCYNCHENDPTQLVVANGFFADALGDSASTTPIEAQVCGQCHNEYYFNGQTKATTNPYVGTEAMTAEAILAYYDQLGFKDWEHPDTGAPMLKAQHPEFETIYGGKGSRMAAAGFSCADCHMATEYDAEGAKYASHYLVSPLESEAQMEKCGLCHDDIASEVAQWQASVTSREHKIAARIEDYIQALTAKKDQLDANTLAKAQQIHRHAQFYWDFVMVENSEGAHNPSACHENLDKAERLLDEGFALLA